MKPEIWIVYTHSDDIENINSYEWSGDEYVSEERYSCIMNQGELADEERIKIQKTILNHLNKKQIDCNIFEDYSEYYTYHYVNQEFAMDNYPDIDELVIINNLLVKHAPFRLEYLLVDEEDDEQDPETVVGYHRLESEVIDSISSCESIKYEETIFSFISLCSNYKLSLLDNVPPPDFKKVNWKDVSTIIVAYSNGWYDIYLFYGYDVNTLKEIIDKLRSDW